MEARATFPSVPGSARAARHWASRWGSTWAGDQNDALELVVSELVTHSAGLGAGQIEVVLRHHEGHVLGFVQHDGEAPFRFGDSDAARWVPRLLAELTRSWDVRDEGSDRGVHFVIEVPAAPPSASSDGQTD